MTRDPDLFRDILLASQAAAPNRSVGLPEIPGADPQSVLEHIELLDDAGLVEARILRSGMGGGRIATAHIIRLTNAGHDFLAKAKSRSVWDRTKTAFAAKGMDVSLDFLASLLAKFAAEAVRP